MVSVETTVVISSWQLSVGASMAMLPSNIYHYHKIWVADVDFLILLIAYTADI